MKLRGVLDHPVILGSALLAMVIVVGTVGYMSIEHWGVLDSVWMVVITLTTIGFGEVHTLTPTGRWFTLVLILAGVSIGTYTMSQVTAQLVEGKMGAAIRTRRRRRQLESLRDHFIVIGYGRLGQTIVDELVSARVPVAVIEKNPSCIARLEQHGHPFVQGDGADDDVLRAAGILRARGLAIAVSSSAEAVFATLSARELNPTLNIVTRVADAEHALKAKRAGATSVVSPHTMGGWRMAHGLVRPHATSFLDLATLATHAEIQLDEFAVEPGSPLVGETLGKVRVGERFGVLVVAIRRGDGNMLTTPSASTVVAANDVVIVIGRPDGVRAFGASLGAARTA